MEWVERGGMGGRGRRGEGREGGRGWEGRVPGCGTLVYAILLSSVVLQTVVTEFLSTSAPSGVFASRLCLLTTRESQRSQPP